ncbi:hypothetical protein V8D89_004819 [Ganoderma adspersum]
MLGRFQERIGEGSATDRSTSTPKPRKGITRTPPPAAPGHWRDAAPWTLTLQARATANRKRKPQASRPQGRPQALADCVDGGGAEEVGGRVAPDGRWYARLRNALRSPSGPAGCGPRPRPILVPDSRTTSLGSGSPLEHAGPDASEHELYSSIGACLLLGGAGGRPQRRGRCAHQSYRNNRTVRVSYSLVPDVYVYHVRIYVSYPTFECVRAYVHVRRGGSIT